MRYRNEDAIDGAEISSPRKDFFFWYTAQPWANAQKVSAEKMRTTERAYQ